MKSDFLAYFKDLIEGRDVPTWRVWWRDHSQELASALPRQKYLRLKFGKVRAAADLLRENSISFSWSVRGLRQTVYADLHPSAVDEEGHPRPEIRAKAYNGALAAFARGDKENGSRLLNSYLDELKHKTNEMQRAEELAEFEFDAEQLWDEGQSDAAIAMLLGVARWETESDLEQPIIRFARVKLAEYGKAFSEGKRDGDGA